MSKTDVIGFLVYGVCFLLYHFIYFLLTKHKPSLTKKGRINQCISSWLKDTTERGQHLLIVHQIRNMIMSLTFLASASILLIGFFLAYVLPDIANSVGTKIIRPLNYPGWLSFFTLAYCFLNLLLALRHLNNFTVLVRSSPEKLEKIENIPAQQYLEKLFLKGSQRYMLGRRGFLYAIATMFWYVNIWVFVALTILLTFTLAYNHDFQL